MNDVVCFVSIHPAITDSSSQIPDFKYLCSHRHAIFQLKGIALNMSFQPKCERSLKNDFHIDTSMIKLTLRLYHMHRRANGDVRSIATPMILRSSSAEATVLPDLQNPLPKAFEELQLRGHMTKT
uniref:Uncharacterized protein n=2 Tax=Leersia perrieri TaxID=77586 RepID=A0A0D9XIQ2_9ORYZ